jgi:uncharacterized protein (DUF433 family)
MIANDIDGSPCIKGIRIVRIHIWRELRGESIASLLKMYPALTKAEILEALAFAASNPAILKEEIAKEYLR